MSKLLKLYNNRVPELDGIRGLAVSMVLVFHFVNNQVGSIADPSRFSQILFKVTSTFWSGVDLFFILSGYLIGSILLKNKHAGNYFKAFYFRRILRIAPLYYLLILIYLALKYFQFPDPGKFIFGNEIPIWPYFLFLQNYFMGFLNTLASPPLTPTWSLAIEEQFYLLLPSLIFFVRKKYIPYILVACILIAPFFRSLAINWYQEYTSFHTRMDTLMFGVLISYLVQEKNLLSFLKGKEITVLVVFIIVLISGGYFSVIQKIGVFNHSFFMIIYGLLLVCALAYNKSFIGVFFRIKFLRWIGYLSYSIYIFHQLIVGVLHAVLLDQNPRLGNLNDLLVTSLALVVTIVFSYIVHMKLEYPLIRFGQKFKYIKS
jgi:peptidoglycan/LPS O-acetylase OafA/YrhL